MITDVHGIRVGHWSDESAQTGCTVVLLPEGAIASGEVRGGAPGTRDFALLEPGRLVAGVNAVVLTGGSAYGLAACDGVMRWCEEHGLGFKTRAGLVPIVVGAVIYDLAVGDPSVRPGAPEGYAACAAAAAGPFPVGRIGVGTGATFGKIGGPSTTRPGGLGTSTVRDGEIVVSALVVVNAVGHLYPRPANSLGHPVGALENTTVGVVATNAALSKTMCHLLAQSGHAGMARALDPVHTRRDGDAIVAVSAGRLDAPVDVVRALAADAVEQAIRAAVA